MTNLETRIRKVLTITYEVRQIPYNQQSDKQRRISYRVDAILGELGNRLDSGFYKS
jgi:hypothetical protein